VDAGLIIHESRFTYPEHGLHCVLDLGEWWERETGAAIPLGGSWRAARSARDRIREIDRAIRDPWSAPSPSGPPLPYMRNTRRRWTTRSCAVTWTST
jgi:1,4-dihydroxy-6-naphthoate synthase